MKRICIDMDEVLADTLTEHLARYNRDHSGDEVETITKAHLTGKWLYQVVAADRLQRLESYLRSEDFFEDLPLIPDSQRVVAALNERYEIFIATAAMEFPNSFGPKFRWLRRHFPFLNPRHFVFCGDKGILLADYLIDDQPLQFSRFRGKGILFSAPHNAHVKGFKRVRDWQEVEAVFL